MLNLLFTTSLKAINMKQTIIISLVVGLLAFSGGYFFDQSGLISRQNFNKNSSNYQVKTDNSLGNNVKIISLSGAVQSINGSTITLKINESDERTVETDNQTKIYIQEQKDPAQYQKEMDEYLKKTQEQANIQLKPEEISTAPIASNLSPEMFTKKIGSMMDIKNDITLTVVANEDIKDAKQIKAVQIIIPPPATLPTSITPIAIPANQ